MPSERGKPETSAASLSYDKATKKAKTSQSTLPPRIREWAALLPAEPEDQDPIVQAVRSESVSLGINNSSSKPECHSLIQVFTEAMKLWKGFLPLFR